MPSEQSPATHPSSRLGALALPFAALGAALLTLTAPVSGPSSSRLQAGQRLAGGQGLVSPNGQYRLTMQPRGNLLEHMGSRVLWASHTSGNPGATAVMQPDGNLVVFSASNRPLWTSHTGGHPAGAYFASLQSDGNLVIHGPRKVVWQNKVHVSTLLGGQALAAGQYLTSPNRRYVLVMQPHGNLVEHAGSRVVWASHTAGTPGARVVLRRDGDLVVDSARGPAAWSSLTGRRPAGAYSLSLGANGRLTIRGPRGTVWTNAADDPVGFQSSTGGYPYAYVPCIYPPYATSGTGYWCRGYNWGTIHKKATAKSELSPYGYPYRNCTDFMAYELWRLGVSRNRYIGLGNANTWGTRARSHGVTNNSTPAVGSVAVRTTGPFGHVALVTTVASGRITVVQYDVAQDGNYSIQTGTPRSLGFSSFDHFEVYER